MLGDEIPWVATHPLFGPLSLALAERPLRVVLCPAKAHPRAAARVRELYERIGCEVVEQTPEGHDRVMAHTHALTFFVAKGMIDAGAGMEVPFAPPSFQAIARTIETVRSDAGHLFAAIARDNPFAGGGPQAARPGARRRSIARSTHGHRATRTRRPIPREASRSPTSASARPSSNRRASTSTRWTARLYACSRSAPASRSGPRGRRRVIGAPVLDSTREAEVMGARRAWAEELKLDADAVADVFRAIMTMSRRAQRG